MKQETHRPDPARLRSMAEEAKDPIVAQALRDLAAEYERIVASVHWKVA